MEGSSRDQGRRYVNPHEPQIRRSLWDHILWFLGYYKDKTPVFKPPEDFAYPNPSVSLDLNAPTLTWVNHSTFLIEVDGCAILTDPVWDGRCSPLRSIGPKRRKEPPFDVHDLPPIDYVLISHDHYDHLDKKTVRQLARMQPDTTWFVPIGLGRWFAKQGVDRVVELDWWQKQTVRSCTPDTPGVTVTAVPSQHYSGRGLFDKNRSLWCGFVIDFERPDGSSKRVYFAGDTGYNPHDFSLIGEHFGGVDLSLIPIGVYRPREFMRAVHISPEEAVKIHSEVKSDLSIGGHWGTFKLSAEPHQLPPYDLFQAMQEEGLDPLTFRALDEGQSINW